MFISDWNGNDGWQRDVGGTRSKATGPNIDHTLGTVTGFYCYSEVQGNKNTEHSLTLDVGGAFPYEKISFWYSMYGSQINYMKFQSSTDGTTYSDLFSKSGQQTSSSKQWSYAEVIISDQAQYFRFLSKDSNGNKADNALDDFKVHPFAFPVLAPTASPVVSPPCTTFELSGSSAGYSEGGTTTLGTSNELFESEFSRGFNIVHYGSFDPNSSIEDWVKAPGIFANVDTYLSSGDAMLEILEALPPGALVVILAKDSPDAQSPSNLDKTLKDYMAYEFGATQFGSVGFRSSYGLIGFKGAAAPLSESYVAENGGAASVSANLECDGPSDPVVAPTASPVLDGSDDGSDELSDAPITLPTVKIDLSTNYIGRNDYSKGTVQVECPVGECKSVFAEQTFQSGEQLSMGIRGRGHSTWEQAKKPFQLKLDDKDKFLDMPKDKKWIFLTGYSDAALLRTALAFELGHRSSLEWTPKGEFANVKIKYGDNNDYEDLGVYFITQKVEDTGRRVDLDDKGYLLEWDNFQYKPIEKEIYCKDYAYVWADEYCKIEDEICECETGKEDENGDDVMVLCTSYQESVKKDDGTCTATSPTVFETTLTQGSERINIKEPDLEKIIAKEDSTKNGLETATGDGAAIAAAIVTRIDNFLTNFESKLGADTDSGWAAIEDMIDVDSFVDWYLINEIAKNTDARHYSSIYSNVKFCGDLVDAVELELNECEGKLAMGPLWDFNIGFGNMDYGNPENSDGWWVNQHRWVSRLLKFPEFKDKVVQRFGDYYAMKEDILGLLDTWKGRLTAAATANGVIWNQIFAVPPTIWPVPDGMAAADYGEAVDNLKAWYSARLDWMNDKVAEL